MELFFIWYFSDNVFTENQIGESIGFVYLITNKQTGHKYIGKKLFNFSKTKQIKGKRKRFLVKSDWETYYGSNAELCNEVKTIGPEHFQREILYLCNSKSECSYWESYEIFFRHALIDKKYYNSWISCRINSKNLSKLNIV